MFHINDMVIYGPQGVCQIISIEEQKVNGEIRKFFVLKPKSNNGTTFYVPTWNEKALGKMRRVMSKNDVDTLIDAMPDQEPYWIENDNERKDVYTKILASGDHAATISMLQAIFIHKKERESKGKRLHMSDENFMKSAEHLLYNEWQYVLNVDQEDLMHYIFDRIQNKR